MTRMWMGDFKQTQEAASRLLQAYDPDKHRNDLGVYNYDPKLGALVWGGYRLWALGYPDRAKQAALDGLDLARHLGHAFHLCWSLTTGTWGLRLRGETRVARDWIAEAHTIAREHAMTLMADVMVPLWDGGVLVEQGDYAEGYAKLTYGSKVWRDSGGLSGIPMTNMLRAKALIGLQRFDEARSLLDEALALINQTGQRADEAEVYRVLGELHQQRLTPDVHAAKASFLKALEVARSQEAKGWELRAATSLARLWESQGKRREACELLAPIYNWFTEGFDTRDLQDAKSLLEALN